MRIPGYAALAAAVIAFAPMTAAADPLNYAGVRTMVEGMGHTTSDVSKTPGEEKFEVVITTEGFTVPLGFEVSKSGRYIWCTAFLGKSTLDGARALALLKRGGSVQPTTFWMTDKDELKIGIAIDNRDVTPAHLKFVMEKLAADVGKTADVWQAPPQ